MRVAVDNTLRVGGLPGGALIGHGAMEDALAVPDNPAEPVDGDLAFRAIMTIDWITVQDAETITTALLAAANGAAADNNAKHAAVMNVIVDNVLALAW